ncbi:MAG: non-ribosomal peptide synthetase module [Thermobacillus sp. ZCTH02-B1]|uniref:non-ribosomal peptide synthetase module n=1 Tax=Thermobacillus sp. ZCTH02-B1 TaxID=1858795 RepID=UPI000B5733DA|nr:non-ribosomal peptide synthetase module [Thermobacillus sp. ZCTH02-B1]OUM96110.1 MAG: non-ribosomal peptide synthetase module [Thermobacillus sp. ZCTH02-B1]
MAKRLATEYVNARLQLTADELDRFIRFVGAQNIRIRLRVIGCGSQEMELADEASGEEVSLRFELCGDRYVCELSCRLVHPQLTNAMRRAVAAFRGDAVVNRIYLGFTMTYYYKKGAVHKIVEHGRDGARIVFERRDTVGELESLYESRQVEMEIERIQDAIDELLDLRNQCTSQAEKQAVDERLRQLTRRLFILEAE